MNPVLIKQTMQQRFNVKASKNHCAIKVTGKGEKDMASNLKERLDNALMLLDDADNVYRTKVYIIKQKVVFVEGKPGTTLILSEDTFYTRTRKRDEDYELLFESRGKKIDGKRITSAMCTRKYAD